MASASEMHKSAITDHMIQENHVANWAEVKVLDQDQDTNARRVREAIWIRRHNTMNRDEGAYTTTQVYSTEHALKNKQSTVSHNAC